METFLCRGRSVHKTPITVCVDYTRQRICIDGFLFKTTSNEKKQTTCSRKASDDFGGRMPKNYKRFDPIWQRIKL